MVQHVMLDWETLSTSADAMPIALGAVKFDPFSPPNITQHAGTLDTFYVVIDPRQGLYGMDVSMDTLVWWWDPKRAEARDRIWTAWQDGSAVDLASALNGFNEWLALSATYPGLDADIPDPICVWGNGANFDNPIASAAYRHTGVEPAWPFYMDRCYRTLKSAAPDVKMERYGILHHARDDAVSQAIHMQRIVAHLNLKTL